MRVEKMDSISNNKPFTYEQKNKATKVVNAITYASIPVVYSLARGLVTEGNVVAKTGAALNTAKGFGLFMAGAALFNKAATSIINNVKPLKDFSEKHQGLTSIGVTLSSILAGNKIFNYGNNAFEEKLNNVLQNSTILKNQTLKKVVGSASDFANNSKVKFLGKTAMLGMGILFIKNIFDLGKMDYKTSKAKQS